MYGLEGFLIHFVECFNANFENEAIGAVISSSIHCYYPVSLCVLLCMYHQDKMWIEFLGAKLMAWKGQLDAGFSKCSCEAGEHAYSAYSLCTRLLG